MQFVDKFYEMDPLSEDLLFDGSRLANGMRVLFGEPELRADISDENAMANPGTATFTNHLEKAKIYNRWMLVSELTINRNRSMVLFIATFDDGTKRKVCMDLAYPWIVKINTLPPPDTDWNVSSGASLLGGRHDGDQTQIFDKNDILGR